MANIELDGVNKKIKVDSGDLTLDVPGDIVLDADGGDVVFADGGTNLLKVTNSSSDVVLQPQVDTKDIVFKQYDGTVVATVEDNATFNIPTDKLAINGTAVTATAAELNLIDGGTARGTTAIADGDGVLINDAGTMRQTTVETLKTYIGGFDVSSITGATALAVTPASSDEAVISDAGTLKRIDFKHLRNNPSFLVKLSGDQNISHNTVTKITWDSEIQDSNAAFGSNKFTVPTGEDGVYMFMCGLELDGIDNAESVDLYWYKNGSNIEFGSVKFYQSADNQLSRNVSSVCLNLAADDYIEVYVAQNEGGTIPIESDVAFFAGFKMFTA